VYKYSFIFVMPNFNISVFKSKRVVEHIKIYSSSIKTHTHTYTHSQSVYIRQKETKKKEQEAAAITTQRRV